MTPVRAGSRDTRQRGEVSARLAVTDNFRTAQQLHADLRATGSRIGLTTVYRILQRLIDTGEVDVMRLPNGERLFRRCPAATHHHHLVCRHCGHTIEIGNLGVDIRAAQLAAAHGFTDLTHIVEIFGTCAGCATSTASERPSPTEDSHRPQENPIS
ncbi:transcriptional repressor [Actinoplanes sp. NPDC049802]|uniref:Fur family transcriptional regulator n=1 Tax=Actinoplanes sp. NPDC049802 TaxID=3154742 RepID=UPI0033FF1616